MFFTNFIQRILHRVFPFIILLKKLEFITFSCYNEYTIMQQTNRLCISKMIAYIAVSVVLLLPAWHSVQAVVVHDLIFPVIGASYFSNDFGAGRIGHTHQGNDIFGKKMQPLVAAQDGYFRYVPYPEPEYGYAIFLNGDDGYDYWYIHLNNDTPGTDNGRGGGMNAYAYDILSGNPVVKGQLIGYMGDSGNAEATSPHLHFEIHGADGNAFNPYDSILAAKKITKPVSAPPLPGEILPFQNFRGGTNIARGDVDPEYPGEEIIVGAGPGGVPSVKVYSADNNRLYEFLAYPAGFHGGLDVATGDINGDGIDEIITGAGPGSSPQVRVFDKQGVAQNSFMAFDEKFHGGVHVTAADLIGDGVAEIITGAGSGGSSRILVFNGSGEKLYQFFAYNTASRQGVNVAAQPATTTSPGAIIVSAGPGDKPYVRIFDISGMLQHEFLAYPEAFQGGVNLDVGNIDALNPGFEIITVPASNGSPQIRIFSKDGRSLSNEWVFEPWWRGGYDIGAGEGVLTISTQAGPRRSSVRAVQIINHFSHYHL